MRAPKWVRCVLWGLVGVRLVCPFSFESVFSLIPSSETLPESILMSPAPSINSGIPVVNGVINPIISESFAPVPGASVNPMQIVATVAAYLWAAGVLVMLLYMAVSYFRIRLKVQEAVVKEGNVYLCDHLASPFILGVIKPKVYLPSNIAEEDAAYVIAHERAHLRRKDHFWKPFAFLLLSIHWFNPLLWFGYILLCKDIELACDETVIAEQGVECKKSYSEALIHCSVPRRAITACPLAFGEVGVKGRINGILKYKKPTFWVKSTALLLCLIATVTFLCDPIGGAAVPSVGNSNIDTATAALYRKHPFLRTVDLALFDIRETVNEDGSVTVEYDFSPYGYDVFYEKYTVTIFPDEVLTVKASSAPYSYSRFIGRINEKRKISKGKQRRFWLPSPRLKMPFISRRGAVTKAKFCYSPFLRVFILFRI